MKTFKQYYHEKTSSVDNWDQVKNSSGELQAALEILQQINSTGAEALIVGGAIGKKLGKDAKRWADGECRGEDEYSSDFEGPVVLCPKLLWCGVQNAAAKSDLKNLLK